MIYSVGFVLALILAPMLLRVAKSQGFMSINIFIGTMQACASNDCALKATGMKCRLHSLP